MIAIGAVAAARLPAASAALGDVEGFRSWLARAAAGESCLYHSGFLGIDRMPKHSSLPDTQRAELSRLADAVLAAADAGEVLLAQRRLAQGAAYLAIKATVPMPSRKTWR